MRTDDSYYDIHVVYDEENNEFIAKFGGYDEKLGSTYGVGDTKGLAVLNLIENARPWELQE